MQANNLPKSGAGITSRAAPPAIHVPVDFGFESPLTPLHDEVSAPELKVETARKRKRSVDRFAESAYTADVGGDKPSSISPGASPDSIAGQGTPSTTSETLSAASTPSAMDTPNAHSPGTDALFGSSQPVTSSTAASSVTPLSDISSPSPPSLSVLPSFSPSVLPPVLHASHDRSHKSHVFTTQASSHTPIGRRSGTQAIEMLANTEQYRAAQQVLKQAQRMTGGPDVEEECSGAEGLATMTLSQPPVTEGGESSKLSSGADLPIHGHSVSCAFARTNVVNSTLPTSSQANPISGSVHAPVQFFQFNVFPGAQAPNHPPFFERLPVVSSLVPALDSLAATANVLHQQQMQREQQQLVQQQYPPLNPSQPLGNPLPQLLNQLLQLQSSVHNFSNLWPVQSVHPLNSYNGALASSAWQHLSSLIQPVVMHPPTQSVSPFPTFTPSFGSSQAQIGFPSVGSKPSSPAAASRGNSGPGSGSEADVSSFGLRPALLSLASQLQCQGAMVQGDWSSKARYFIAEATRKGCSVWSRVEFAKHFQIKGGFRSGLGEVTIGSMNGETCVYKEAKRASNASFSYAVKCLHIEAEMLLRLSDRGLSSVVSLRGIVVDGQGDALVIVGLILPHIDGRTLDEFSSDSRVSVRERLQAAVGVAKVFVTLHAHSPPIAYRDLKPGNIIVRTSPRSSLSSPASAKEHSEKKSAWPEVVLLDFGTARFVNPSTGGIDTDNPRAGTRAYCSPEQRRESTRPTLLTPATDVFSFGVLLLQLVMGRVPAVTLPSDLGPDAAPKEVQCPIDPWPRSFSAEQRHVFWAELCAPCLAINAAHRPSFPAIATILEKFTAGLECAPG